MTFGNRLLLIFTLAASASPGVAQRPEIFVMNLDNGEIVRLTNNDASDEEPEWSPDGYRVLFDSTRDGGGHDLYVMDANGSSVFGSLRVSCQGRPWSLVARWSSYQASKTQRLKDRRRSTDGNQIDLNSRSDYSSSIDAADEVVRANARTGHTFV